MQLRNNIFRALKSRNFRIYWLGMSASQIGNWVQQIAIGWVAYRLTESAGALGLLSLCNNIGVLILAPFAGVWIDKLNKHRLIYYTQALFLLEALVLAVLSVTGSIQFWHLVTLSLTMSVVAAIDMPLRQTLVAELVNEKELLSNAVALNSLSFNLSRIIGPAIGGYLLANVSESACFILNAFSFLMIMFSLSCLRWSFEPKIPFTEKHHFWKNLRDGIQYAFLFVPIRSLLLTLCLSGLTLAPFSTLVPAIIRQLYDGNSVMAGSIYGGFGLGAIIAVGYLAYHQSAKGLEKAIFIAILSASIALIVLSSTHVYWVGLLLSPILGAGIITNIVASNSLLQILVEDDKRGRVMSLFVMISVGVYPLGASGIGFISTYLGLYLTLIMAGGFGVLAAFIYCYYLPHLRTAISSID
ncbi:MFS transporter [Xenorhabdus bharatensis]|uniref:MFS transporter n=1 Tax=Xenorhabdus bharatensis TaxID=3136256 RepID=UPI0030F39E23